LLHLEELAKEQDICRHDFYNAQLHFAVFAHSNQRKFTEIHLPDPNAPAGSNRTAVKISKSMYRGPSVDHIFEIPLFQKYKDGTGSSDNDVYVLGMIKHAGLSEGRPAVCIGDAVHLRPINRSDIEIVCLVASIDGDVMFLVMPQAFWRTFASLENALCLRAVQLPAGGGSSSSLKTATVLKGMPKGAFSGKVHVRFSFDRRPFVHMQTALRAADLKMNSNVCLVPPVLSGSENLIANMRYLQPTLAQVHEIESKVELLCGRSGLPLNTEQRHAVSAVLAGGGRQTPYALHGPPGTGKTVTMVSAALQLLSTYPEARLLLCAPQNYSADLLCSALATAGLLKTQVLRLNDPRRPPYSSKEDTLDYTLLNTTSGLFELPQSLRQLKSFSVVVCTCTAAALMYPYYDPHFSGPEASALSSPRVGFSHVLIDESGQALLPEALIPLVLLSPPPPLDLFLDNNNNNITTTTNETLSSAAHSNNTNHLSPAWGAMLCGDPKQLGPTVHSLAASASGLSSSLLEHLIAAHWESSASMLNAGLVPSTSMLLANYRSHASLLNLPSKLFYRGQLLAAADPDSVLAPQWKETQRSQPLPGEEMGIVEEEIVDENIDNEDEFSQITTSASLMFYGVRGQQMRESDIPSYHNPLEAAAVADLVAGLLESKNAGVSLSDVGVMATYRRQVTTLRLLLRQRGLGQVRVGTVDDYQGQEERIIFISTVFSTVPHHAVGQQKGQQQGDDQSNDGGDAQYVGLWNNPKRFNVAITRAKALLVVVGHPAVLLEDPSWKELLRHCASIGAVRGAGASALAERLGMDLGSSGLDFIDNYEIGNGHSEEHVDSVEMAKAIDQMASLALLGAGDQAQMFPETLEEAYASYADEMEWRIML
jgi:putative helicase MOV10L1